MKISSHIDTLIWDLDGTILDSFGISYEVLLEVFPRHGRPAPRLEDVALHYHGSLEETMRGLAPDADDTEIETLLSDFMTIDNVYIASADDHFFGDAVRLAERAYKAGKRQILVSNRSHGQDRGNGSPRNLIRGSKLSDYFDAIVCGDEVEERKPSRKAIAHLVVDMANILTVGDQFVDAQFAQNLGAKSVLVKRDGGQPAHLARLGDNWEDDVVIVPTLDDVEL